MKSWQKSLLLIACVAFIGASNGAVIKWGARSLPGIGFATGRMAIALLCVLPIIISKKLWKLKQKPKLFAFSLFATGNIIFFILGIKLTSISISAALYTAVPLLTVVLSRIIYNEQIHIKRMAGIVTGLIGTMIVLITPIIAKETQGVGSLRGNLIILLGVLCFTLHTTFSKSIQKHFSSTIVTAGFIFTGSVLLLPIALWEMQTTGNWLNAIKLPQISALLYSGAIGTVGLYFLYQQAIKHTSPLITSLSMYLQPVFAIILGILVFQEQLTPSFVIGTLLSFIGVLIVTTSQKKSVIIAESEKSW